MTIDCHFHILTPTSLQDYQTLGYKKGVIVQASTQGTDNTSLLLALEKLGSNYRATCGADLTHTDKNLALWNQQGVRGARFNTLGAVKIKWEDVEQYARRVIPLEWHLDFFIKPDLLNEWAPKLQTLPLPIIIDHMALLHPADSPTPLLKLIDKGKCWVKLSAPYRCSNEPFPHQDIRPLTKTLIQHAPDRMLWGSDWPHLGFDQAKDPELHHLIHNWAGKETHKILVDNPTALYRFS